MYQLLLREDKNKVLSESTYTALVELFMNNGYMDHASYFLCRMDKQKMKIPRSLLDLFLEYSAINNIPEKAKNADLSSKMAHNKTDLNNKYDNYNPQADPDYAYYFSKRNLYKQRKNIQKLFSSLDVTSRPFYPKSFNDEANNIDKIKSKLSEIDPNKIKEFIPKSYKIEKKN